MKTKGQITIEFLITFAIVIMIFLIGIFIFEQRNLMNSISEEQWEGQETADNLARVINIVYLSDDNFAYTEFLRWDRGDIEVENSVIRVFGKKGYFYDAYVIPESVAWEVTVQDDYVTCSKVSGKVRCYNG